MGTVRDFEKKILELEEIVIVVRASPNDEIDDYPYERMAAGNTSISNWIEQRIRPVLGSRDFVIINGEHNTAPHGRTKLSTLRDGYEK
jgi:hypothetical protein